MELKVKRTILGYDFTVGNFSVNEKFLSNCLEDKVRIPFVKIAGKTAIPSGRYEVILDYSNRFKRVMPHVLNVPQFQGIRIHAGNTDEDTEGCILLGDNSPGSRKVLNSQNYMAVLMDILDRAADRKEKMFLTID